MIHPTEPKIYHIVHVDRVPSIVAHGFLWSDVESRNRKISGTSIGLPSVKSRRRAKEVESCPGLMVGNCVPFNFCPRSVMLYVIHKGNLEELPYSGGQGMIVHLEADLEQAVSWAKKNGLHWAFTRSNAASNYAEYYDGFEQLGQIDWKAVYENSWQQPEVKEAKQAEFLIEKRFPWGLITRIGVNTERVRREVQEALKNLAESPVVSIQKNWYY